MKKKVLGRVAICLFVGTAGAEVRQSSRNLKPLTQPSAAATADTQSGRAGTGVAVAVSKDEKPVGTVTKVSFVGPPRGWGVVKAASPYYAPDGKRLGTLPGGTLFKYDGVKTTSKNAVLVSTVKRGETWEGPCLLDCTNIAGYEGDPDTLNPALVASLANYFTLNGKIVERKAALEEASLTANPHLESARQAQQAYQASAEKAADMEKQMNALTGLRREKMMDALRSLKYEQAQLKTKADKAAATYKAWKAANPPDPAQLATDPQLQQWQGELEAARKPVVALLPADAD
jgi:hypothetical protein